MNPGCQVAWATKSCTVVPTICGYSVWTFLYLTLLAPGFLKWVLDLWEICAPLVHSRFQVDLDTMLTWFHGTWFYRHI
jgi:hypothetical protein